ncbi:MAG: hypothetical protein V4760_05675, partial [Bdellovibrionota bacterium]
MPARREQAFVLFSFFVLMIVVILTAGADAANSPDDSVTPASTTVAGTAFGETFKAGYAYAKRDPNDGTIFVMFGNGKTGGCEVTSSNETAYVGMNHPAKAGTYSASPSEAYFSTSSLEPRAFQSFKIDVKNVTASTVQGSLEMVS